MYIGVLKLGWVQTPEISIKKINTYIGFDKYVCMYSFDHTYLIGKIDPDSKNCNTWRLFMNLHSLLQFSFFETTFFTKAGIGLTS
jgi:hypothetical protein